MAEEDDTLLREQVSTKVSPAHHHTAKIAQFRRERDQKGVIRGLSGVLSAMKGSGNLVEAVVQAMDQQATVGEIVTAMRRSVGIASDAFDQPLPEGL